MVYTNMYALILDSSTCRSRSLTILDEPIRLPEHLFLPNFRHLIFGSLTVNDLQRLFQVTPLLRHFKFNLNSDQFDPSLIYQPQNSKTSITRHVTLSKRNEEDKIDCNNRILQSSSVVIFWSHNPFVILGQIILCSPNPSWICFHCNKEGILFLLVSSCR